MPYKNIVFVKLEKRLLNDHRWYMMSEPAQLNYIRFILFASETYNKIPKNIEAIKKAFKTDQDIKTIQTTIKEIKVNFPKFKENKHFYYFDGFNEKTNYIPHREIPGKSQGKPKEVVYLDKYLDKDKYKDLVFILDILKKQNISPPSEIVDKVRKSYDKHYKQIKNPRGWIYSAFKTQWAEYNAQNEIKESKELNQLSNDPRIRELIRGAK